MSDLLNATTNVGSSATITQLFEQLELFSDGTPPTHTLFIQGRPTLAESNPLQPAGEQLLLIDPPANVAERFRLPSDTAVLFTSVANSVSLPHVQTQPGGVAHLRIGQHYLDLYTQIGSALVYLPALGIICGGSFGSDAALPRVAEQSTGQQELETLRLIAQLVKQRRFQLYITQIGQVAGNAVEVMERLAADVAYLHSIRRIVLPVAQQEESFTQIEAVAQSLLPSTRQSALCQEQHLTNLRHLYDASATPTAP